MDSSSQLHPRSITRRRLLASSFAVGSLLVAACSQPAAPAPTAAPAQSAAAPTKPPATAAPAAAAAPAATPTAAAAAAAPTTAAAPASPTAQPTAQAAPQAANGAPVVPLLRSSANEIQFLKDDIALFQKNNPSITVNPVFVPGNQYNQKTDLMIAAGNPPSLWFPASDRGFKYYSAKGLNMDLDPLIKSDNYDLSDFYPRGLKGSQWKGHQEALPISEWAWVLFYNKTLFDNAKLPYPPQDWKDATWTWDKYLETAKALTVTAGGRATQFGAGLPGDSRDFFSGWTHGGWWFNQDWADSGWVSKFQPDPAVAEALQYWADAANKLNVAPTAAAEQSSMAGAPDLFMSGKLAMSPNSIGNLAQYAQITSFEWGMAAWPHPTTLPAHCGIWVDEYSMFAKAANPEGSWAFMKHMVSVDGEKIYPMSYGPIPSHQSLGQQWIQTWKDKMPKVADQLSVAVNAVPLQFVTPDNFTVNFSPINDEGIQPQIDKVYLGQLTATAAITAMKPKVDQQIAETTKGAS